MFKFHPLRRGQINSPGEHSMKISVIGSGYVGLVAGACLAELGHEVILIDNDKERYAALAEGGCPIHEHYLPELLARHRGKRLSFADDLTEPVRKSEVVFIAVGTPPTSNGSADLSYVEAVARGIAGSVNTYKVVVGKSTVPVYTSEWVRRIMLLNGAPSHLFDVASNPEFLREGTAVTDFLYPDRIVIGANTTRAAKILHEVYRPMLDGSYYRGADLISSPRATELPPPMLTTSTQSAELIKYASNAFLAMKVSFINAVSTICDRVGADVEQVRRGVGLDSRIGCRFLNPGIGYGGSCFPKDVAAYRAVARDCGYDFRLLEEVIRINNDQRQLFLHKVSSVLWTLKGKHLGVLGLAFKNGTDDVRESPAISIVQSLLAEGCEISAYDPAATERARHLLPNENIHYVSSAYDAAKDADALLILTEWDDFKLLDFGHIRKLLRYPIVIDGRNLLDPEAMRQLNFHYVSIGRPDILPRNDVTHEVAIARFTAVESYAVEVRRPNGLAQP
jgi:UDPglucose 6-dehydrogenase